MTNTDTNIEIGNLLFKAENEIDDLLRTSAELLGRVSQMRGDEGASMLDTQKPIARLAGMQQLLAGVRMKLTGVHGDLAKLAPSLKDLPWGCDCSPMTGAEPGTLAKA